MHGWNENIGIYTPYLLCCCCRIQDGEYFGGGYPMFGDYFPAHLHEHPGAGMHGFLAPPHGGSTADVAGIQSQQLLERIQSM